MAAYSQDLRDRVLTACLRGERPVNVAARFEVSRAWVYRVWQRFRETGENQSKPIGGYRRSRLEGFDQLLAEWINQQADLTLAEICQRLAVQEGVTISQSALWCRLKCLGYTFKKNRGRRRTTKA